MNAIVTNSIAKLSPNLRRIRNKFKRSIQRNYHDVLNILFLNFRKVVKRKQIIKRYKEFYRAIATRKNQDNFDITRAYTRLSVTILLLILLWTALNALAMYHNQKENFVARAQIQKVIIEKNFSSSIGLVDNFSSYIGDKILLFGIENRQAIATILKKNSSTDITLDTNFYSWLDLDYVDSKQRLSVTSSDGVLRNFQKVPDYYPLEESLKAKWQFHLGGVVSMPSNFGSYDIVPVAFSIDDDDAIPRGTLISRIVLKRVSDEIRKNVEDSDVSYIILDKELNFIIYSANDKILDDVKKKKNITKKLLANKELREILDNASDFGDVKRDGVLKEPINIGNATYSSYRKADYPFIILASYSKETFLRTFYQRVKPLLFQSITITLLFLSTLSIFRIFQIVPIIKQLIEARSKAEDANQAKSSFLSTISHELRTPMNGIIGMSHILAESNNMDDEEFDQIQTINQSANALLLILNDILSFSKLEAKKLELELIDFNLYELLENTIDIMFPAVMKKDLELFIKIDPSIPKMIVGDPGRIRQIITNLVNNAIKFTSKGQVVVEVVCKKKVKDQLMLRFNIRDSGIGIKPDDLKKLFTKFTQADMSTTRKYGGTGLGLAICKALVELMDGEIGIESEVDVGSNFWFSILFPKSELVALTPKEPERLKTAKRTFAIIDSNKVGYTILKDKLLNLFPVKVDQIFLPKDPKPELIIDELKAHKYSTVLINYSKGRSLNGLELAKLIKANNKLAELPLVLIISAYDKTQVKPEDLKIFSAIITNPIKELSLINAVLTANKIEHKRETRFKREEQVVEKIQTIDENFVSYKILLCEDNPINVKVAMATLGKMGHQIESAPNGQEGYDKIFDADHKKYDIILMDCMMPVMDGYSATRLIRKEEKVRGFAYTPIIALTANIMDADQDKCYECGMDAFLSKPIRKEVITETIEKLLEEQKKKPKSK